MKVYRITPAYEFKYPVQADVLKPELFEENPLEEILSIEVYEGRRKRLLGELFKVEETGESEETTLELIGDFSKVRRVGKGMTKGVVRVKGVAGIGFGEGMRGSTIIVHGDAGWSVGYKMREGLIIVEGNARGFSRNPHDRWDDRC